jgi:hypothetical protein
MTLVPVADGSPRRYWQDLPALRGAVSGAETGFSVTDGILALDEHEPSRRRWGGPWR